MTIAQGTQKQVRIKRQAAKGTLAVAGSGGQILRRTSATFELQKENYTTETEITTTRQLLSNRHGVKLVNGSVAGIMECTTYSDILSTLLMRDFAAVTAITSLSLTIGVGSVVNGFQTYTVARGTGDFLAGNIKIGMVPI